MKVLLDLIKTRAKALTDSMTFSRHGRTSGVALDYHLNVLPAKEVTELAPFCLVGPLDGSIGTTRSLKMSLQFCLYQENRDQAITDLENLTAPLWQLSHPGAWSPWTVKQVHDFFGAKDNGEQPHPLYFYTLHIAFENPQTLKFKPWR